MKITVVRPEDADKVLTDSDREMDRRAQEGINRSIEKSRLMGKPIAKFDGERAYLEYPDGSRRYGK